MKALPTIGLSVFIAVVLAGPAAGRLFGQTAGQEPATITSDDFPRSRDLDVTEDIQSGKSVFVFPDKRKPTFKLKRIVPRKKYISAKRAAASKKPYKLPVAAKGPDIWRQLGVTIWRLEKAAGMGDDNGVTARLLVQGDAYEPKRVTADTVFRLGDLVRLSFESPAAGYIYVIDREIYSDGTVGEPMQIFPTMMARGGNNRVEPGSIIDVPAQTDRVPFFRLGSTDSKWQGELLTIIISPRPLPDVGVPDRAALVSASMVDALEDKYLKPASEYEQESAGSAYTRAEQAAGGDGTRQLTQGDPFPQTIYRVKAPAGAPMVMSMPLRVQN